MKLGRLFLAAALCGLAAGSRIYDKRDSMLNTKWPEERSISKSKQTSSTLATIVNGTSSNTGNSSTSATNTTTISSESSCDMLGNVSQNQQVSWSTFIIQTCCTDTTKATCFFRSNDDTSGNAATTADADKCFQVPACPALLAGDSLYMAGFRALNSTWGKGTLHNQYNFAVNTDGVARLPIAISTLTAIAIATTMVSLTL